ncbi:MAG TPA: 2-phosphosulfolactate phosphatase [Gemmatimonadales bacterium]|nr:2-phosphosulfolactate phosphatase [Gemmatimonadales bacterium]
MKLDVVFAAAGLTPGEVQGRTVFVIDILRAATSMCAALAHGARAVVPVASTEEALRLATTLGASETVLAGERNALPIPGFAVGNSPREMTPEVVRGKTVIMTTSNGTGALLAVASSPQVYVACAANFSVVSARAHETWTRGEDLLIVCAGREQRFALDDAYCAGRLVEAATGGGRGRKGLNDAAIATLDLVRRYGRTWERPLAASRAGRELVELGFKEDLADAARVDAYPVLAQFHNRRVSIPAAPAGTPV